MDPNARTRLNRKYDYQCRRAGRALHTGSLNLRNSEASRPQWLTSRASALYPRGCCHGDAERTAIAERRRRAPPPAFKRLRQRADQRAGGKVPHAPQEE